MNNSTGQSLSWTINWLAPLNWDCHYLQLHYQQFRLQIHNWIWAHQHCHPVSKLISAFIQMKNKLRFATYSRRRLGQRLSRISIIQISPPHSTPPTPLTLSDPNINRQCNLSLRIAPSSGCKIKDWVGQDSPDRKDCRRVHLETKCECGILDRRQPFWEPFFLKVSPGFTSPWTQRVSVASCLLL